MQKLVPLMLCLLLLSFQAPAPTTVIDRKYQLLVASQQLYAHLRKNETEISPEGAHIDAYYDSTGFRIVAESVFAVMSQNKTELYFDPGNQLILVIDRHITYATPMYDSAFNIRDAKTQVARYYFNQRKMIQWTGPKAKDSTSRQYRDQQASWLDYTDNMVKQMVKFYQKNPPAGPYRLPVSTAVE